MKKIFFIISILLQTNLWAQKNKVVMIRKLEDIPKGKFIFVVIDTDTDQMYMGYSKKDPKLKGEKNIKGIRNGGHVQVLRDAMNETNGTLESFLSKIERKGKGRFLGGGFVLDYDDIVRIHPAFSHRAGGLLGKGRFTINKLLPGADSVLIPNRYRDYFYTILRTNLGKEMKSTPDEGSFLGFQDNKNGSHYWADKSHIYDSEKQQTFLDIHNDYLKNSNEVPVYDLPKEPITKRPFINIKKYHKNIKNIMKCMISNFRS